MKKLIGARGVGFTLIELMLVVAIIGLLAAIAIPKFANLVVKAKEASIKGKLGSLRSAISLYYADNEGYYAPSIVGLTANQSPLIPKYLDQIPYIEIPTFPSHVRGNIQTAEIAGLPLVTDFSLPTPASAQAWAYGSAIGRVLVGCNHTDSNGTTWSLW